MQKLKASITFRQGLALAFTLVVGSGLLGLPGITIDQFGPYNTALSWLVTILSLIPLFYIFVRIGVNPPFRRWALPLRENRGGPVGR